MKAAKPSDMERHRSHNLISEFKSTVELFSNPTPTLFTLFSQEHSLHSLQANIPLLDFSPFDSLATEDPTTGDRQGHDTTKSLRQSSHLSQSDTRKNISPPGTTSLPRPPQRDASPFFESVKPEFSFQDDYDTPTPVFSLKKSPGTGPLGSQKQCGFSKPEKFDPLDNQELVSTLHEANGKKAKDCGKDQGDKKSDESKGTALREAFKGMTKTEAMQPQETTGSLPTVQGPLSSLSCIQILADGLLQRTPTQTENSGIPLPQSSRSPLDDFRGYRKGALPRETDACPPPSNHQTPNFANPELSLGHGDSTKLTNSFPDQRSLPHQFPGSTNITRKTNGSDISELAALSSGSQRYDNQEGPGSTQVSMSGKTLASILNDELIEQAQRHGVDLS